MEPSGFDAEAIFKTINEINENMNVFISSSLIFPFITFEEDAEITAWIQKTEDILTMDPDDHQANEHMAVIFSCEKIEVSLGPLSDEYDDSEDEDAIPIRSKATVGNFLVIHVKALPATQESETSKKYRPLRIEVLLMQTDTPPVDVCTAMALSSFALPVLIELGSFPNECFDDDLKYILNDIISYKFSLDENPGHGRGNCTTLVNQLTDLYFPQFGYHVYTEKDTDFNEADSSKKWDYSIKVRHVKKRGEEGEKITEFITLSQKIKKDSMY